MKENLLLRDGSKCKQKINDPEFSTLKCRLNLENFIFFACLLDPFFPPLSFLSSLKCGELGHLPLPEFGNFTSGHKPRGF